MKLTFISHAILKTELSQFVHVTHETVRVRATFAAVMPKFPAEFAKFLSLRMSLT